MIKKILIILISLFVFVTACKKEDDNLSGTTPPLAYNCVNNDCVAVSGGQYITLEDCQSVCNENNNISFNCLNNSCVDPGDGSGIYNNIQDCESQCANVNTSYDCINNSCVDPGDGSGIYNNIQDCESQCANVNTSYDCINNSCIDPGDGTGQFNSLQDCENQCINSSSCSVNNFTVSSGSQNILNGIAEIIHFGNIWNSTTNYEIRLFTSSITGNANGPTYAGVGDMILLDLNTDGDPAGTYSYSPNTFPPNPSINTCTPKYFLNQDMSIYSNCMAFPSSGSSLNNLVIIDNGNNNFDIEFSFNTSNGLIEGCYSGQLTYWNTGGSSGGSGIGPKNNSSNPYAW